MAAGKEIKRLRTGAKPKISATQAASLIGIGVDKLRKWEARNTDPSDTGDIQKVEAFFGRKLADLQKLDNVHFNWTNGQKPAKIDPQAHISDLREYNAFLKKHLEINSDDQLETLQVILNYQKTIFHFLGRAVSKVERRDLKDVLDEMNTFLDGGVLDGARRDS